MLSLHLFFYQGTAEAYFGEVEGQVFSYRIDREHFGSREKSSGLSPGRIGAWEGDLFGMTLPGLEPGSAGVTTQALLPKAKMLLK